METNVNTRMVRLILKWCLVVMVAVGIGLGAAVLLDGCADHKPVTAPSAVAPAVTMAAVYYYLAPGRLEDGSWGCRTGDLGVITETGWVRSAAQTMENRQDGHGAHQWMCRVQASATGLSSGQ